MSVTGSPDGPPMKVGVAIADLLTGMYAATAVLAALAHRDRSGRGQHVELALLDVQIATLANQVESYLATGRSPPRLGNSHPSIVPYQAFATRDGHAVLAVGNDGQFARFCAAADRPELAADERFSTNSARVRNREELVTLLEPVLAARTTREWASALDAASVPFGPINDLAAVFDDPHVRARGLRVEAPHPTCGRVPMVASPIRLSETPARHDVPPPTLGQHTREVLVEVLGMADSEVEALRRRGII